ncbi:MAG: hypothetical protein J6J81_01845 [Oscillospiraceae bacterium]|nr:hypothetical protein [Oscillospiraceae bacterium]
MKHRQEYTKQQWLWVWERHCEGYTIKELAAFLGVHHETVRRRFQKMGLRAELREDLVELDERRREFRALQQERCA